MPDRPSGKFPHLISNIRLQAMLRASHAVCGGKSACREFAGKNKEKNTAVPSKRPTVFMNG